MKRVVLAALVLVLWPHGASAHDVPDRVGISVFIKPEGRRLVVVARVPANALIDFLLPTLPVGNWLDLPNANPVAAEAARVWIADLLMLDENGVALPTPVVRAIRLSRVNDPSFKTFETALSRIRGATLPADALVTQDQVTVDALLDTPINGADSSFSVEPRFGRLGVVVDTTVAFVSPRGGIRQFQYQGDPERFDLDPGVARTRTRFLRSGFAAFFTNTDFLLFALCVALTVRPARALAGFSAAAVCAEFTALAAAVALAPSNALFRGLCAVLMAAATVYVGIEAVVAVSRDRDDRRLGLAIGTGLIVGGGFWISLQPIMQFGGTHAVAAGLGFAAGSIAAQALTLGLLAAIVAIVLRSTRAPRAAVMIAAAVAIHVSWRLMLDRADALALVAATASPGNLGAIIQIGAATLAIMLGTAYYRRRRQIGLSRSAA
jgi:hypothetical protein